MKKPQLKTLRLIAAEMVKKGAPASDHVRYHNGIANTARKKVPINHYRRMKRLVTRGKMPLGKAIDYHVAKYFDLSTFPAIQK